MKKIPEAYRHHATFLCVGLLGILSTWPISAAPATSYHVIDLGNPLTVGAIGEDSTVAGSVTSNRLQQAALLYPTPTMLGFLPDGTSSHPSGIAGSTVVGDATTGPFGLYTHGFIWTAQGGMQDLGTAGDPSLFSTATSVNTSGLIVGYADGTPVQA